MGDLSNLPNFQTATNYSHADMNAVFQALTLAVGAVTTNKVADKAITLAKLQDIGTGKLIGRASAGTGVPELIDCTAAGRAILAAADAAAQRTVLGAQPASEILSMLAALGPAENLLAFFSAEDEADVTPLTPFARTLLDDADAATALATLGAQPKHTILTALAAVAAAPNVLPYFTDDNAAAVTPLSNFARSLLDDADAAAARVTINAQASHALLTALAGLASAANKLPYFTGANAATLTDFTPFARTILDDADAGAVRTTLGIGSMATRNLTISTGDPAGGNPGDIWIKVAA